ncbi:mucin-5AC-like isoform X3 [Mya arenaria]|uniref:mucin-5AC-like isoform X3 n=1 Tax=Mya arenaria TaxID=6604 RepID=UPI0022E399BA|nr:mucin-5AC-like isoform X3 [Mya arenaria]
MGLYMIFIWIFLNGVCRHVIEAQAPVLSANASSVTKGHPLKLVCTLSAETLSVTWLKTDTGTTTEHTIVTVGLSGGSCASVPSTPPDGLVVTCGSTLDYGCTIPSLNISDDGDVWRCSVPIKGVTTYSNSLRINVTEPAPTPTEPAPTPTEPAPTPTEPAPTLTEVQAPVLSANASSVTKGHPLKLVCTLSAETLSVTWYRTDTGKTTEQTIVTVGLSGGSCISVPSTPPDALVVTCSTLDYGCTIPSLNISDDGDVWRCSVPIKGVTTYSNSLRINVTEPAPTPTEPAPTPTVTVPSVTGEKHLAVAVTLLVVQICVVLGVFVVLHWIRTRPRGMNFVLWRPWVVIHVGGVIDLVVVCVCGGYHVNINTGVLMTTGVIVAIILTLILVVAFVFLVTRATKCCGFYNTKKETSPLLERKEVHQQLL